MIRFGAIFCVIILAIYGCKKPFTPLVTSSSNSYLVVEGVINLGNDSTVFKINQTVKLNDSSTFNPLLGAMVTVEGEQNGVYNLSDFNNNGHYNSIMGLNLPANQRYRLRIKTGSKEYASDFVEVKLTPPIDSIGYLVKDGNVNLYINSHDPASNSRYYRYDYDETWQFHSKYISSFVLDPTTNTIVYRNADQQISYCFGHDVSSHIVLNSTENLSNDVVFQAPLSVIPLTSEKFETRYSILVKQYAVTKDAFSFYQLLKKNTEQIGSIFDVLPSQLTGNIHCVTQPNEPVIGYVTATNVQQKRIYINHTDLPGGVQPIYPYDCEEQLALFSDPKTNTNEVQNTLINPPIVYIPTTPYIKGNPPAILGFYYSTAICTDCTLRGTKQAPAWWQY
jgi:hypothetical protein